MYDQLSPFEKRVVAKFGTRKKQSDSSNVILYILELDTGQHVYDGWDITIDRSGTKYVITFTNAHLGCSHTKTLPIVEWKFAEGEKLTRTNVSLRPDQLQRGRLYPGGVASLVRDAIDAYPL